MAEPRLARCGGPAPARRVIGLSAHDFQQAVAAPEVWLCRARPGRGDGHRAVALAEPADQPALKGASEESNAALEDMTRGARDWVRMAEASATGGPDPARAAARARAARRCAPVRDQRDRGGGPGARPLQGLRAPRAGLRPLDPLAPQPDAALRGSAHNVLDRFVGRFRYVSHEAEGQLMSHRHDVLATSTHGPPPAALAG
jgi:ATP-dependent helicase/nuclease subunit B